MIDQYGKCRGIELNNITLFCTPMPPLPVPTKPFSYKPQDIGHVTDFLKENKFEDLTVHLDPVSHRIYEISFLFPDFPTRFSIKVDLNDASDIENIKDIGGIKRVEGCDYPNDNPTFSLYSYNRQLASIMIEYLLFFFSDWMYKKQQTNYDLYEKKEDTLNKIKEFAKEIVIDPSYLLGHRYIIPKIPRLSMSILRRNQFLTDDDEFVVDSVDTRKRLIYVLYNRLLFNEEQIKNYYKEREIYNFYTELKQWSNDPSTIVVRDLTLIQKMDNTIYSDIQPDKLYYFFQNPTILRNSPCFLFASADEENNLEKLKNTFYRSEKWNTRQLAIGDLNEKLSENKKLIYGYVSTDQVESYEIENKNRMPIEYSLFYKIEDESYFYSVLPLNLEIQSIEE